MSRTLLCWLCYWRMLLLWQCYFTCYCFCYVIDESCFGYVIYKCYCFRCYWEMLLSLLCYRCMLLHHTLSMNFTFVLLYWWMDVIVKVYWIRCYWEMLFNVICCWEMLMHRICYYWWQLLRHLECFRYILHRDMYLYMNVFGCQIIDGFTSSCVLSVTNFGTPHVNLSYIIILYWKSSIDVRPNQSSCFWAMNIFCLYISNSWF